MFWFKKKKERERAEAERALNVTRQKSAQARAREERDKRLFASIKSIRRENHIADAVGRIMEGR